MTLKWNVVILMKFSSLAVMKISSKLLHFHFSAVWMHTHTKHCCWLSILVLELKWNHLTHWGRVTHICISKLTTIVSDNGLALGRCQANIQTNVRILLIGHLGTNFRKFESNSYISFKKMYFKMSYVEWRPFCLGLNVLIINFTTSRAKMANNISWDFILMQKCM